MTTLADQGILLAKYKSTSNINVLRMLLPNSEVRAFLCRTPKKKILLQTLTILSFLEKKTPKSDLAMLTNLEFKEAYQLIYHDFQKSSVFMFLSEILREVYKEGIVCSQQEYDFIEASLLAFDHGEFQPNFHVWFLLKLADYHGVLPDLSTDAKPYYNFVRNEFQDISSSECWDKETVSYLVAFLGTKFANLSSLKLSGKQRSRLLNEIITYFKVHIQGFSGGESLQVLRSIMD